MKRSNLLLVTPFVLFFVMIMIMLVLTGTAMAEDNLLRPAIYSGPETLFTPLGNTSPSDYGWTGGCKATKDGYSYHLLAKPGAEFLFSVPLAKLVPFVNPGGVYIDLTVTPEPNDEQVTNILDYWVDIETVEITEDDRIVVVFHITVPNDIPKDIYQFHSTTDNLEPQAGDIDLTIEVSDNLP